MAVVLMGERRQSRGLHPGRDVPEPLPQRRCGRGISSSRTRRSRQTNVNQVEVRCVSHRADMVAEGCHCLR